MWVLLNWCGLHGENQIMVAPCKFRTMPAALFFLLMSPMFVSGQNDRFEIIYMADTKYAKDQAWLDRIKTDWHATGINLRIMWSQVENEAHALNWTEVDAALRALAKNKLDIYIRVSFIFTRNQWFSQPGFYTADDFQRRWNGEYYLNAYPQNLDTPGQHGKMLTFIAPNARSKMKQFYEEVVKHLERQPAGVKKKIKLVVPALTPDDESEYLWHGWIAGKDSVEMSGYAPPELEAFINFLQTKYNNDHRKLNTAWASKFSSIDKAQIKIANYNWHKQQGPKDRPYQHPKGRKAWIDFKTGELKKFFEQLAAVTQKAKFKFGLQFGSLYDNVMTYRGFYDPTPLLEKIDYLIIGEVLEHEPNFNFSADYARSLCKYWDWKNSRASNNKIKFASETNWPGYNNHSSQLLNASWAQQMRAFYERGASAVFVSHWGTMDTGEGMGIPARVKNGKLLKPYAAWSKTLHSYKNIPLQNIEHNLATHLSCEQGLYFRSDSGFGGSTDYFYNNGFQVSQNPPRYEFPFNRFIKPKGVQSQGIVSQKPGNDIVTNYMLVNSPEYVTKNYQNLQLTVTSYILPEPANKMLQRHDMKNMVVKDPLFQTRARVE